MSKMAAGCHLGFSETEKFYH